MRRSIAVALAAIAAACTIAAAAQDGGGPRELGTPTWLDDPRGDALPRFHAALRRVASDGEVARVVVWGASHVAEDRITGVLRARLGRRFGDAGLGLVPAVPPFSLYDHLDVEHEGGGGWSGWMVRGRAREPGAYGRAGFAVEARARTWARVRPRASNTRSAELWGWAQPGGGSVSLRSGGARARLETAGDEGPVYGEAIAVRGAIEVRTGGDGPVRLFGVDLATGEPGIVVEAFGIPGARARDRLPWDDAVLRAHLRRRPPAMIVLAYGTNESGGGQRLSTVEREVRRAIRRTRAIVPDAACVVIGPSDWPERTGGAYRARARTRETNEIYRRATHTEGCAYFDLLRFQGGAGSAVRWYAAGMMLPDHVHFTDEGYARIAHALERAWLRGYR